VSPSSSIVTVQGNTLASVAEVTVTLTAAAEYIAAAALAVNPAVVEA